MHADGAHDTGTDALRCFVSPHAHGGRALELQFFTDELDFEFINELHMK